MPHFNVQHTSTYVHFTMSIICSRLFYYYYYFSCTVSICIVCWKSVTSFISFQQVQIDMTCKSTYQLNVINWTALQEFTYVKCIATSFNHTSIHLLSSSHHMNAFKAYVRLWKWENYLLNLYFPIFSTYRLKKRK